MTLRVLIHSAEEGGYRAEVPALPGCVSQGETMDEIRSNVREAIEGWLLAEDHKSELKPADHVIELAVWSRSPAVGLRGLVQRRGWHLSRIHGSHYIFVMPDWRERLVIPVHGNHPLKTGLLRSLMKIAGLDERDL